MSGLIWSALGNAVSNFGTNFGNGMIRQIERDEQEQRELERERRADQRDEAKFQRRKEAEEAERMKQAGIFDQAEKNALVSADRERFEKFRKDAKTSGSEADDATLRKLFDENYNDQVVAGSDRYTTKYSRDRQLVLDEVRRLGGNSESIRSAQQSVKDAQTAEDQAARRAIERADLLAREKKGDQQFAVLMQRDETTRRGQDIRRDSPGGGKGGSPEERAATTADLQRQVDNAEARMLMIVGGSNKDLMDNINRLRKKADQGDQAAKKKFEELEPMYQRWVSASDRLDAYKNPTASGQGSSYSAAPGKPAGSKDRPPLSSFQLPTKN
jgi:hypothetical protein